MKKKVNIYSRRVLNNYNTMKEINKSKEIKKSRSDLFKESDHAKFVNMEVHNSSIDELYNKFEIKRALAIKEALRNGYEAIQ